LKSKSQPEELANKKNNFKRSYFRIIQWSVYFRSVESYYTGKIKQTQLIQKNLRHKNLFFLYAPLDKHKPDYYLPPIRIIFFFLQCKKSKKNLIYFLIS
jgi:hypothetical protein